VRLGEHLRRGVDSPDTGKAPFREQAGELAGAAADVEHSAAAELRLADDDLEDLEPVLVDRPQTLVVGGASAEIRTTRR
jgi:acyl transferase domain-containing protein